MRFGSLPCAVSCFALACGTLGCAVPDVQFYPDDSGAKDGAASDAPADGVPTDGPTDAPMDAPSDAGTSSCPDAAPFGAVCCGPIPCFGMQCAADCTPTKCGTCMPGEACCTKANNWACLPPGSPCI